MGSGGEEKPLLDGGGGLRLPICHPERSEGSSFGGRSGLRGKDPSAALPPQDDKERRHWCLRMTGEGVLAPQDDGGKGIGVSG